VEPQRSIVRFDEASLGRFEPQTNPTRGKARENPHRHPNGEVLLDNADAVIDDAVVLGLLSGLRSSALRAAWEIRHSDPDRTIDVLQTEDGFGTRWVQRGELIHHIADVSGLDEVAAGKALSAIESLIRFHLRRQEGNPIIGVADLGTISEPIPESGKFEITFSDELCLAPSHQAKVMTAT